MHKNDLGLINYFINYYYYNSDQNLRILRQILKYELSHISKLQSLSANKK